MRAIRGKRDPSHLSPSLALVSDSFGGSILIGGVTPSILTSELRVSWRSRILAYPDILGIRSRCVGRSVEARWMR